MSNDVLTPQLLALYNEIEHLQQCNARLAAENAALRAQTPTDTDQAEQPAPHRLAQTIIQAIIEAFAANTAVIDADGAIIAVNRAWCAFAEENQPIQGNVNEGANYLAVVDKAVGEASEGAAEVAKGIRVVLAGEQERFELEYPCHMPWEKRWFIAHIARFTVGDEVYAVVAHEDITARRQIEEAINELMDRLNLIMERMPIGCALTDADLRFIYWNPAAEQIFGYTAKEMLGQTPYATIWAHLSHLHSESIRQRLSEGTIPPHGAGSVQVKDGRTIICEWQNTVLRDSHGTFVGFLGMVQDVTERVQSEQMRQELLDRLNLIMERMPIGCMTLDTDFRVTYWNPAAEAIFGYSNAEMLGQQPMHTLIAETQWSKLDVLMQYLMHYPKNECGVNENVTKDGRIITCNWLHTPLYDAGGALIGFLAMAQDITERKESERRLQHAFDELEQRVAERTRELSAANAELSRVMRVKDEFLANMSHELRTPLNAILGFSEMLYEGVYGELNSEQAQKIRTVEESGRHLLQLINDILDLAKIGSGHARLIIETVHVPEVCESSLRLIKQMAHKKNLAVLPNLNPAITTMQADGRRLKQIIINLLSNAVKFTPEGGQVGLDVSSESGSGLIQFSVWDTGIGIAPEHLQNLFLPFVQVDSSLARSHEGAGLGLNLVAQLAEMHGGSVSVESAVGQGSRFTVALPWESGLPEHVRAEAVASAEESVTSASDSRHAPTRGEAPLILMAEDNVDSLEMLLEYLELRGFRVVVAHNGEEAIQLAGERQPAIILMDIQMPRVDGLEAIRRIRADAELASIPIIALTALAMPGDRERCLEAGANDYLCKPVNLKLLMGMIDNLL